MPDDLRRLPPAEPRGQPITIELDGEPVRAFEGEPVALALFAQGIRLLSRSTKYHRPRGLFCASGHCASCLMRIDGQPNLRACLEPARAGLRCERQNAFPDPDIDLLRAADWLFPKGMDHHRLMTGSRLGNQLFVKLVRQMGGTGTLPDDPPASLPAAADVEVDVCIVGGGPAGLTAAATVAGRRPGTRVLVIDDQDRPGGSLLAEPGGLAQGANLARQTSQTGVTLWPSSTAIAFYPEERRLAVKRPAQLCRVSARRYLYATGSYDQNLPVEDNDRPGVLAARAVGRLAFRFGVRPGERVVIACPPDHAPVGYLGRLQSGLQALGVPVSQHEAGALPRIDLDQDVIAAGAMPAPASELARQHGAPVRFDLARGGFWVVADPEGQCAPGVYVAGDVTGYAGPEAAAIAGARVGTAVADSL